MKYAIITFLSFVFTSFNGMAKTTDTNVSVNNFGYGNSIIFVENGVTYSVYPDGEFDFFINRPEFGARFGNGNVNISFNAGYNYDPFIQYDDFGAVIQIQNTPLYYDYYGRINRIGSVNIFYNNNRVSRVGGLVIYYNNYGGFNRFAGYINVYNRNFVYRPYYSYFSRPRVNYCMVNYRPYRRYYNPVRYTYYRPYKNNHRKVYATVGRDYHYKDRNPRVNMYRNDRRVVARKDLNVRKEVRNRSISYENNRRKPQQYSRVSSKTQKTPQRRNSPVVQSRSSNVRKTTVRRTSTVQKKPVNNKKVTSDRQRSYTQNAGKVTTRPANRNVSSNNSSRQKSTKTTYKRTSSSKKQNNKATSSRGNSRRQ